MGVGISAASHQGTLVIPGAEPVADVKRRAATSRRQELELAAWHDLNALNLAARGDDPVLAARLRSFETAFGMQMSVPDAFEF